MEANVLGFRLSALGLWALGCGTLISQRLFVNTRSYCWYVHKHKLVLQANGFGSTTLCYYSYLVDQLCTTAIREQRLQQDSGL